jgi:hypothetical protein
MGQAGQGLRSLAFLTWLELSRANKRGKIMIRFRTSYQPYRLSTYKLVRSAIVKRWWKLTGRRMAPIEIRYLSR